MLSCFSFKENYALSSSSSTFTTTSISATDVTNLSVSLTVSGNRPVLLALIADGSSNSAFFQVETGASSLAIIDGTILFKRDGTTISELIKNQSRLVADFDIADRYPPGAFMVFDYPTAGTYTYKVQAFVGSTQYTLTCQYMKLLAMEWMA